MLLPCALMLLAGCRVGPDYQRPPATGTNALPAAFSGPGAGTNDPQWKPAAPAAGLDRGPWWRVFEDAELNRLEDLANANNQNLAAAAARFAQAHALVNVARADLFPQVEVDPSYTRQRQSYNLPSNGKPIGATPTYNTFIGVAEAGWEADVWGRIHRQVESARAKLEASADDLAAAQLSLQAELATDYFALRALEAEEQLVQSTVEVYRLSLGFVRNRRQGGVVGDLDVAQAETQLKSTEAALPALRLEYSRLLHALAVLSGQPASAFAIAPVKSVAAPVSTNGGFIVGPVLPAPPPPPPAVPVSLPSELLERRPDIAASERRMAAANAQVGVAQGAFYPHLRVNGLGGFESVSASTWWNGASGMWAVGPTLQLPLFTGGRNRAQLAYARASYDETVAAYRQTVLSAFGEVEDALAAQRWLDAQLEAELAALKAARRTVEIANNRYHAGLITYLEVSTAQSAELAIERTVVQLREDKLAASVSLIKALGGGWKAPAELAGRAGETEARR